MSTYVWEGSVWVKDHDRSPLVIMYGRNTETKELKRFGYKNFVPYFYYADPDGEFLNCYGEPISKLTCHTPDEVPNLRKGYDRTFEADIPFEMRFVIDKKIYYGFNDKMEPVDIPVMPPRVCYFDIEVSSPQEVMPSTSTVDWPIVMIQLLDSYTGDITVFTLKGDQVDPCQVVCETESELLIKFGQWMEHINPDIITGWYSEHFDVPYIMRRARKIGTYIKGLSRTERLVSSEDRWPGRTKIDLLDFYKDWSKPKGQLPSYDLKFVVKHETKGEFTYVDYGDQIGELVERGDWKTLVQYGKNDVIALQLIDQKTGLIMFYEALRRLVGIKMEDTLTRSKIIEYFLMHKGIKPIPTRVHKENVSDYKGALVIQPTAGIKKNVGVTDLKALYPSIIIAFDISPDVDKTIPKVIVELMEVRDQMRKVKLEGKASEAMKTSEQSLKYIINAFYGYLAFSGARLYQPELAGQVTRVGREIAGELHQFIKDMGKSVDYGDTDSTFMSPIMSVEEGLSIQDALNNYLKEWASKHGVKPEHAPTLKLEKIYSKLLIKKASDGDEAAKKRYAGLLTWKDGNPKNELDYVGLEIRRSDTAPVTKKMMEEFFQLVLVEDDIDKAVRMIKDVTTNLEDHKYSVHDIAIPKGVHKREGNTAWVRGLHNGEQLLKIKFREDKKPKLIYCLRPVDVICIDDDVDHNDVVKTVEIDWEKMIYVLVEKKMKSLVESVGKSWNQQMHGQMTLGSDDDVDYI